MNELIRKLIARGIILMFPVALMGCGAKPQFQTPPPPAETVVAQVVVPVPCEIAHVDQPAYPAAQARKGDNIFDLSKIALADRKVRMAETTELRAANNTPCPGAK